MHGDLIAVLLNRVAKVFVARSILTTPLITAGTLRVLVFLKPCIGVPGIVTLFTNMPTLRIQVDRLTSSTNGSKHSRHCNAQDLNGQDPPPIAENSVATLIPIRSFQMKCCYWVASPFVEARSSRPVHTEYQNRR